MLFNSYSNRFCDFYIFPIVGIGAINFQSKKTGNPYLFLGVFSHQKTWEIFCFYFHKQHNMTNVFVQNLCFCRARFSIQSLFKTTPCPLERQRENHTGVLASDTNVPWISSRVVKLLIGFLTFLVQQLLPKQLNLVKLSKKIFYPNFGYFFTTLELETPES